MSDILMVGYTYNAYVSEGGIELVCVEHPEIIGVGMTQEEANKDLRKKMIGYALIQYSAENPCENPSSMMVSGWLNETYY